MTLNRARKWGVALLVFVSLQAWLALAPPAHAAGRDGLTPRPELLTDPAWLAQNLRAERVRIVDLRGMLPYTLGHIPGAAHFDFRVISAERDGIIGMLSPIEEVEAEIRKAGIAADSIVIAYDDRGGLMAARLFWVLDYLGQEGGRVLDGGWQAWRRLELPVSQESVTPTPSDFTARPNPDRIATLPWIKARLGDQDTILVDARHPDEHDGYVKYSEKGGHIPGSKVYNWAFHLSREKRGSLRPLEELAAEYAELGLPGKQEIVVYCQTMVRASHSYFVLKTLGYDNVRGYDGSWAEWGNRTDTPVAGAASKQ